MTGEGQTGGRTGAEPGANHSSGKQIRIVIADNNRKDAEEVRQILEARQFQVIGCIPLDDRVADFVRINQPDLLLIGISSEEMELSRRDLILGIFSSTQVTIIQMIRLLSYDLFGRSVWARTGRYILKPVNPDVLISTINYAFSLQPDATTDDTQVVKPGFFRLISELSFCSEIWCDPAENQPMLITNAFEQITGYTPEEVSESSSLLSDIILEEDRPKYAQHLDEIRKNPAGEFQIGYRIKTKKGEFAWISHSCKPQYDEKGTIVGRRITFLSINLAPEQIQNLISVAHENQDLYFSLAESSPDCVMINDVNSGLVYINPHGARLWFRRPMDMIGLTYYDLYKPDDAEKFLRIDEEVISSGKPYRGESMIKTFLNTEVWYEYQVIPIARDGKQTGKVWVFGHDITDKKEAEKRILETLAEKEHLLQEQEKSRKLLAESEEKFRVLADTAPVGIMIYQDMKIQYVNNVLSGFSGFSREELSTMNVVERIHPDYLPLVRRNLESPDLGDTVTRTYEIKIINQTGKERWVLLSSGPIEYGGRKARIVTMLDIDERKKGEEELERYRAHLEDVVKERTAQLVVLKDQADAANRSKSVFLSHMSHELRTPLNAILGYTRILRRQENITAEQKEYCDVMASSGDHLLRLIEELIDIAKVEMHKITLEESTFNLRDSLQQVISVARLSAEEKGLLLSLDEVSPLPELVKGDERRVKQILINLLSNAVKYTDRGHIFVRVSYGGDDGPDRFSFEVEDTGLGIPEDQTEKIFEPFQQVVTGGRTVQGTGLGLAIVRHLLRLMNGWITVASTVGNGSTFTVSIPLEISDEPAFLPEERPAVRGYEGKRMSVLTVDDNMVNNGLLVSLLEPLGFSVDVALNGKDALKKLKNKPADLLLLDLVMPEMNGVDVIHAISSDPAIVRPKILGITASLSKSDLYCRFIESCDAFIGKPFRESDLLEKIGSLLGITWIQPTATEQDHDGTAPVAKQPVDVPSGEFIALIRQAVRTGDYDELDRLCSDLTSADPKNEPFCSVIRRHARNFQAEKIIRYIDDAAGTGDTGYGRYAREE